MGVFIVGEGMWDRYGMGGIEGMQSIMLSFICFFVLFYIYINKLYYVRLCVDKKKWYDFLLIQIFLHNFVPAIIDTEIPMYIKNIMFNGEDNS